MAANNKVAPEGMISVVPSRGMQIVIDDSKEDVKEPDSGIISNSRKPSTREHRSTSQCQTSLSVPRTPKRSRRGSLKDQEDLRCNEFKRSVFHLTKDFDDEEMNVTYEELRTPRGSAKINDTEGEKIVVFDLNKTGSLPTAMPLKNAGEAIPPSIPALSAVSRSSADVEAAPAGDDKSRDLPKLNSAAKNRWTVTRSRSGRMQQLTVNSALHGENSQPAFIEEEKEDTPELLDSEEGFEGGSTTDSRSSSTRRCFLSLQIGIGGLTSLQILVAIGITWLFLTLKSLESVNIMRSLFQNELATKSDIVISDYLQKSIRAANLAELALRVTDRDIDSPFDGALRSIWNIFKAYPEISLIYVGRSRDGKFFGYQRNFESEGTPYYLGHADMDDPSNMTRVSRPVEEDGQPIWSSFSDSKSYDSRSRSWYKATKEARRSVWTSVYLFAAVEELGLTVTAPIFEDSSNSSSLLQGVIGVDLTLEHVNDFLKEAKERVASTVDNIAYIAEAQPPHYLIAATDGEVKREGPSGSFERIAAANSTGDLIQSGQRALGLQMTETNVHNDVFVISQKVNSSVAGLDWLAVHVIPSASVFGEIYRSNQITVGITAGITIVMVLVAFFSAMIVTGPLRRLQSDMEEVAKLSFRNYNERSWIKELHNIQTTFAKMKVAVRSFARYVPVDVVRAVLDSDHAVRLAVTPRRVSIFFSDIAGFTTYAEKMEPRELVNWLSVYLSVMADLIKASEGVVGEYVGDAVLAFWNGVDGMTCPNHELRACQAALRQVEALEILKQKWKSRGWPMCHIRCGIHTDVVLCGNIGSPERLKYGLVGDGVNLASRLEGLCKRYGVAIILSEETHKAVSSSMLCRRLDKVIVKGKGVATDLYELIATHKKATLSQKARAMKFNALFAMVESGELPQAIGGLERYLQDYRKDRAAELLLAKCRDIEKGFPSGFPEGWTMDPTRLEEK